MLKNKRESKKKIVFIRVCVDNKIKLYNGLCSLRMIRSIRDFIK